MDKFITNHIDDKTEWWNTLNLCFTIFGCVLFCLYVKDISLVRWCWFFLNLLVLFDMTSVFFLNFSIRMNDSKTTSLDIPDQCTVTNSVCSFNNTVNNVQTLTDRVSLVVSISYLIYIIIIIIIIIFFWYNPAMQCSCKAMSII